MCKEIYTPLQIQSLLQPVFADYKVKKAILFGSYAKGLAFFGLLEDVVTTLGKEVDLLDISQLTADSMRVDACVFNLMQIGELAYSPQKLLPCRHLHIRHQSHQMVKNPLTGFFR